MSQQDIIREGIEAISRESFGEDASAYFTDAILRYLHSKGVVTKREECPKVYHRTHEVQCPRCNETFIGDTPSYVVKGLSH